MWWEFGVVADGACIKVRLGARNSIVTIIASGPACPIPPLHASEAWC